MWNDMNGHGQQWYLAKCFIDDIWMLKVVVGEEVELIEEVAYVNATKGVHLGERQYAGKARQVGQKRSDPCQQSIATCVSYLSSLVGMSCVNQLTLTTFSYSSSDWICIGM